MKKIINNKITVFWLCSALLIILLAVVLLISRNTHSPLALGNTTFFYKSHDETVLMMEDDAGNPLEYGSNGGFKAFNPGEFKILNYTEHLIICEKSAADGSIGYAFSDNSYFTFTPENIGLELDEIQALLTPTQFSDYKLISTVGEYAAQIPSDGILAFLFLIGLLILPTATLLIITPEMIPARAEKRGQVSGTPKKPSFILLRICGIIFIAAYAIATLFLIIL